MEAVKIVLELAVVLGAIVMGTRSSGVALGLWGGAGVAVLVFVFGEDVGSPPVDALLIVLSVVLASSMMQAAGGIDWMVTIAAKLIESRPKQITLIAPLVSFLFSVGAGTSNILYPLLPVIYDVSYKNGVRPSRPLSLSVVSTGVALACSPVSAAMAAMVTLTDVPPYDFELIDIIKITFPAAVVGIVLSSIAVNRLGKDLDDDPEIQAKMKSGELAGPGAASKTELVSTKTGRNAALIFLAGVLAIVIFGLFKGIRPEAADGTPMGMTPIIEMLMFVVGTLILLVCRPNVADVPSSTVFRAGMVSAIALFGLAWLTDTFISAHSELITSTVGDWVNAAPWIFALGVFLVCVLTTSQSTATRTIVPIGLAAGIAPGLVSGMWAGAFAGVYLLPTNGSQIAAANFDLSGSTKLGSKLVDHSFFLPTIILAVTTIAAGALFGVVLG
ncbi:anaerobic C4-dicarboxylate transporter family protein [Rhodococcus qingshengii]|jgi:anaerobic C4-dicarboxylate transporter DcuA/anaerobic C4-dicarboxylate transporter DcuB|uniref:Transporter, anaerobic C4-dicarboxylate uptake (Dcu) family n=2 Tax=Rhodococcus erythropolis group TaxID=2840174 RepID=A0A5P3G6N9_RHOER|nr:MULTISPECIES: anaerobic C4-dicarboxylate transporter family protein [Rhodococcus]EEN89349.1 transporter, anaerobic C4-dicarboxylate uptake (Dcu) family [Rhodococcus erythropolis SK121]ERB53868.1 C4-dicarboxylate ABC transporter [Rhodococcus sp. P27]NHE62933.1 anaerobic C4-dicarboxylate transporter [Rhodococcus sp. D-46]OCC21499.1 C4-dicarboxylate ABC transporter [Prescottella equi]ANQ73028.1 C4-dicarboxylate ABC transporter [Rhodococcus sp. 008]